MQSFDTPPPLSILNYLIKYIIIITCQAEQTHKNGMHRWQKKKNSDKKGEHVASKQLSLPSTL